MGRQAGALTILNPAPAQKSLYEDFFNCVDIIIPNEIEIRLLIPDQEGKSIQFGQASVLKATK
eukprot:scaffold10683_cov544-Chaetoceros_neogracile.AAC.1